MTEPTRQQILEAAVRVYSEAGFRGATTRRIADEAGVNEVTLFRIFGSKAALIGEAVRAHAEAREMAPLPEVPVHPEKELTDWAASDHRFMLAYRGMIRTTMAESQERPECAGSTTAHPEKTHHDLCRYIERLAQYRFIPTAKDAKDAAAMLQGALFADAMGRDMMPEMFPPVDRAPATYVRLFLRSLGATAALLLLLLAPVTALAQQSPSSAPARALSLAEALGMAERASEGVAIAGAGVTRARGQQAQANAQRLPQVNGSAGYQRAIQNQFQAITERFADPNDTTSGGGSGGFGAISQIFAAPNTFTFTLAGTQNLYTAGRVRAARAGAGAARDAAEIGLSSARAQSLLEAAQAYFDAVASDRFLAIAESSLVLTERTLAQTQVAREVGSAAEFDLLRARVARDNQRPLVIQARGQRTTAYLRLKQLLGLPLTEELTLTTPIRDDAATAAELSGPIRLADDRVVTPDTSVSARATVRQAEAQLEASRHSLTAARRARFPSVQLSSTYQRFAYPPDGTFLPAAIDLYFPNWNVTLGLSFPVLTGGRLRGERLVAEANLTDAEQRLQQSREGASLDALLALNELEQAQASYLASVGTDAEAAQAYRIAEVRFQEGVSTQLELTQVRVQLDQARLQRVNAARALELARLRLALLKDLPLPMGGR